MSVVLECMNASSYDCLKKSPVLATCCPSHHLILTIFTFVVEELCDFVCKKGIFHIFDDNPISSYKSS